MLAVREGPARPVEKSQCNKERRDLRQTAREAIVARRTLGLMTVSSPSYGAALDVPSWLGEDVAAWIEEKRSSGDLIGCIVAPAGGRRAVRRAHEARGISGCLLADH